MKSASNGGVLEALGDTGVAVQLPLRERTSTVMLSWKVDMNPVPDWPAPSPGFLEET